MVIPAFISCNRKRKMSPRSVFFVLGVSREKEKSENIADIWAAYHDERADSLGTVLPGDALLDLQKRAKKW